MATKMSQKRYILAGSRQEFRGFCRRNNLKPDRDAIDLGSFIPRGLDNIIIERVGTWWKNLRYKYYRRRYLLVCLLEVPLPKEKKEET